jgi:hypothetical protein
LTCTLIGVYLVQNLERNYQEYVMPVTRTASITDLRENLANVLDAPKSQPVMIVRHSKPAAYLVAPEFFVADGAVGGIGGSSRHGGGASGLS